MPRQYSNLSNDPRITTAERLKQALFYAALGSSLLTSGGCGVSASQSPPGARPVTTSPQSARQSSRPIPYTCQDPRPDPSSGRVDTNKLLGWRCFHNALLCVGATKAWQGGNIEVDFVAYEKDTGVAFARWTGAAAAPLLDVEERVDPNDSERVQRDVAFRERKEQAIQTLLNQMHAEEWTDGKKMGVHLISGIADWHLFPICIERSR